MKQKHLITWVVFNYFATLGPLPASKEAPKGPPQSPRPFFPRVSYSIMKYLSNRTINKFFFQSVLEQ